MTRLFHAAYVIGRRDFVASVYSRSFLLFLLGPLIIIAMSAGFGSITQNVARENSRTVVAVIASPADQAAIKDARERLLNGFGAQAIPEFRYLAPSSDVRRQAGALLSRKDERVAAVLVGGLESPRLEGAVGADGPLHRQISLVIDEGRQKRTATRNGIAWKPVEIPVAKVTETAAVVAAARATTATVGQFVLFFLTVLLSGMLLSNLLEEKSNKIIEVLAAAVPVNAIFLGKVVSMLAISLTGIAVWCGAAIAGMLLLGSGGAPLPEPAVGWLLFAVFVVLYFSINYLLLGALFLGIGSQASSVREVQTLSMPITVCQMLIFALAITGAGSIDTPLGLAAAAFPFSSPLTMVAFSAKDSTLWPHLLALLWQGLWVWLVVRFGAALFRRNVLKSGPPLRLFGRRKQREATLQ